MARDMLYLVVNTGVLGLVLGEPLLHKGVIGRHFFLGRISGSYKVGRIEWRQHVVEAEKVI